MITRWHKENFCHAFTLVELLIVMAIISLLAAMLLPVLSQARESAYLTSCASNLKQCGIVLIGYAQDHHTWYPPDSHTLYGGWPWARFHAYSRPFLLSPNEAKVFYCPYRFVAYEISGAKPSNWNNPSVNYIGYGYMAFCHGDAWPSQGREMRGYIDFNPGRWLKAAMRATAASVKKWDGKQEAISEVQLMSDFFRVGRPIDSVPATWEFLDGAHCRSKPRYKGTGWANDMPGRNQLMGDGHVRFLRAWTKVILAQWCAY